MSSINRTPGGKYQVEWRESRKQKGKTFGDKRSASAFAAEIERRLVEGKPIRRRKDVPILREFSIEWLASRSDLEASTQRLYVRWLSTHVWPDLGHLPLIDLRPRRLAEWQQDRLKAGAGPAAIGKTQAVLSQILDWAVLPHEYLDVNPVLALRRPSYPKKQPPWLTAEEVEKLRGWFLDDKNTGSATVVSVLAYVGIRPQDALALTWDRVGERMPVIERNSQGNILPGSKRSGEHRRSVKVPEIVLADLENWRLDSNGTTELVFSRSDGRPWTKTDWDNWRARRFKVAAKDVGLGKDLRPYALRHTAASLYAAAGWDHIEIARQLGHSPEESMRTYQHIIEKHHGQARKPVEQWIAEARGLPREQVVPSVFLEGGS